MAIKSLFNTKAARLESLFPTRDDGTRREIDKILSALNLPLPRDKSALRASEGRLLFLNDYGIVIRMETKRGVDRFDNHPWVLQPLKSFDAGDMVVEICPGCRPAKIGMVYIVDRAIEASGGANFWDTQELNTGILPVRTPAFPDGIPVVIDRPAVSALTESVLDVKKALGEMSVEEDPQPVVYARLRQALDAAFAQGVDNPDKEKVRDFWRLCREEVRNGVLVAGWKEKSRTYTAYKARAARVTGRRYARQMFFKKPEG